MTSENTPEAGALPADASDAHVEHHGQDDSQANVEAGVPAEVDADVAGAAGADPHAMPMPTALFVRRERRMNLGGWVVLALVLGALSGLVWGMFRGVFDVAPLVIAVLYGVLFIGGALALLAVIVDWALERNRAKSRAKK